MADPVAPNIYDILMGDSAQAQQQARVMAALLRHQQDMQVQGATNVEGVNAALGVQAKQGSDLLEKAAIGRLHYGQEAQAQKQAMESMRQQTALQRAMLQLAAAKERQSVSLEHKGEFGPKDIAAKWKEYGAKVTPEIASSRSILGQAGNTMLRGRRLEALAKSVDNMNLTPQEMTEFAAGMAALITGGNQPALRTIEEMRPKTATSSVMNAVQWVTNNPTGTEQQAFIRRWLKTLAREQQVAEHTAKRGALRLLPSYSIYGRKMKELGAGKDVESSLKELGIYDFVDPETLLPKEGAFSEDPYASDAAQPPASGDPVRRKFNPATGRLE